MGKNFDRNSAIYWAELNEMDETKKALADAQPIIDYLKSVYENNIKMALEKKCDCRGVEFKIPKKLRVYGDKKLKVIQSEISKEFKPLGFSVTLYVEHCVCPFNFLCNRNGYTVTIRW